MVARARNEVLPLLGAGALVLVLLAGVALAAAAPRFELASVFATAVTAAVVLFGLFIAARAFAGAAPWRSPYFWVFLAASVLVAFFILHGGGTVAPPKAKLKPKLLLNGVPGGHQGSAKGLVSFVLSAAVVLAIVLAASRAYHWWRESLQPDPPPPPAMSESALQEAIEAALLDLHGEGDHRRAVIAAYAAAEASLASHGAGRLRSESPVEYLDRVVRLLGARSAAVDRLTGLYEQARFSDHRIDAAMRAEAIAAFEGLRTELSDVP